MPTFAPKPAATGLHTKLHVSSVLVCRYQMSEPHSGSDVGQCQRAADSTLQLQVVAHLARLLTPILVLLGFGHHEAQQAAAGRGYPRLSQRSFRRLFTSPGGRYGDRRTRLIFETLLVEAGSEPVKHYRFIWIQDPDRFSQLSGGGLLKVGFRRSTGDLASSAYAAGQYETGFLDQTLEFHSQRGIHSARTIDCQRRGDTCTKVTADGFRRALRDPPGLHVGFFRQKHPARY